MKGRLFLVIGPAGVGKTLLISRVLKYPFLAKPSTLHFLPSYTSRSMRKGEVYGNPYFFVNRDEFEGKIHNDELIEWKFVHNNYYGVGKQEVIDALNKGQNLITDIEVLGAMEILEYFPLYTICIFVDISNKNELLNRMKKRDSNISNDEIEKRLSRVELEYLYKYHFKYLVINDNLDEAVKNMATIISYEISLAERFTRTKNTIIHNSISLLIKNLKNEILLYQKKSPFASIKWDIPNIHILANESPQDAIYRELHSIFPALSDDHKKQIYLLKPVSNRKYTIDTHNHYELEFHIQINLSNIQSENYIFKWVSSI